MQGNKPLKYLNTKNIDKPDSDYLFPLQSQMIKLAFSQQFCFIGEGLKNSLNASMVGIPFISIESSASIKPQLIEFLKSDKMKNIVMMGAFDGDVAGEKAYEKMNQAVPMLNQFSFDSGLDFADYLKEIR